MLSFDINAPKIIMINTSGSWERDDGRVSIANGRVTVASGLPVYGVQLIYDTALERGAKVFGDDGERGYGYHEWRGVGPERLMPWYMQIDEGGMQSFIGVMVQPAAFVGLRAAAKSVTVDIDLRSGGGPVDLSGRSIEACTLVAEFNCAESAYAFQRRMLRKLCPVSRLAKHPVYGGNNWYYAYGKSCRDDILADSEFISGLSENTQNRPYMVIDDGWQKHHIEQGGCCGGPWTGNEDYGDMGALAKQMADAGVRPGIWIRPLYMAEKPKDEWITAVKGANWTIDPSNPEVISYVRGIIRMLKQQGYTLIKHDFSTFDIFDHWGFQVRGRRMGEGVKMADSTRTNAEIIRDLYIAIAGEAGEDCPIIGCNTVSHLAAGLFQIQRTGDDTSGRNWERTRYMGVNTLAMRMPQHRIFYDCDADCAPITEMVDWKLASRWLDVLAKSGTPLFVSADPKKMGEEQKQALREAFARAAVNVIPAEPLDWQETTAPRIWKGAYGIEEYDFDAFYGYDDSAWWR